MSNRVPFAYVVAVAGSKITLNMLDSHRGHFVSHPGGVSPVTEIGNLFGVDDGTRLLVLRVRSLAFLEPREAHLAGVGSTSLRAEPLRHLEAMVLGSIARRGCRLYFAPDSLLSPALGAAGIPLSHNELRVILNQSPDVGRTICLGTDVRGGGQLEVSLSTLMGRHVAVLGSTGQGKSCFTAAVIQQMLTLARPRIVVFDINGEYEQAVTPHVAGDELKVSVVGGANGSLRIPYVALGRHGLERLFLPSEKTQRPALSFALESLRCVQWFPGDGGIGLVGSDEPVLFDDCRPNPGRDAEDMMKALRAKQAPAASEWPHMRALSCLVAESYCLQQGRFGLERNAFQYSHVAPLVTRIRRYSEDPLFESVVDIEGSAPASPGRLSWPEESARLVDEIFGAKDDKWKIHVVNLRNVAHDLLPMLLGALLELLAFEMFERGQGATHPTLLVLEEAHHYLRQIATGEDGAQQMLAYERLAKEGRKFGVSLWIGTQRPSEVSPTVLAQCGTWAVFRLTSEQDLRAVGAAGEWFDRQELDRIAGLPRQQAVVFGAGVNMPVRVIAPVAEPVPKSEDPDFAAWTEPGPTTPQDPKEARNTSASLTSASLTSAPESGPTATGKSGSEENAPAATLAGTNPTDEQRDMPF